MYNHYVYIGVHDIDGKIFKNKKWKGKEPCDSVMCRC